MVLGTPTGQQALCKLAGPTKVSIYVPFQTPQKQPFKKDLAVLGTGATVVNRPQTIPALMEIIA